MGRYNMDRYDMREYTLQIARSPQGEDAQGGLVSGRATDTRHVRVIFLCEKRRGKGGGGYIM